MESDFDKGLEKTQTYRFISKTCLFA